MSDYRLIALSAIAYGTMRETVGGMPATLTTLHNVVPQSAFISFEPPTPNNFFVEDADEPDITVYEAGLKRVEFALQDMSPEYFKLAFGGTTGATLWTSPNTSTVVTQKSMKFVSKDYNGKHLVFDMVNVSLMGGADLQFSKQAPGKLTFVGQINRPICLNTDKAVKMSVI
jgi:hypothetical protein